MSKSFVPCPETGGARPGRCGKAKRLPKNVKSCPYCSGKAQGRANSLTAPSTPQAKKSVSVSVPNSANVYHHGFDSVAEALASENGSTTIRLGKNSTLDLLHSNFTVAGDVFIRSEGMIATEDEIKSGGSFRINGGAGSRVDIVCCGVGDYLELSPGESTQSVEYAYCDGLRMAGESVCTDTHRMGNVELDTSVATEVISRGDQKFNLSASGSKAHQVNLIARGEADRVKPALALSESSIENTTIDSYARDGNAGTVLLADGCDISGYDMRVSGAHVALKGVRAAGKGRPRISFDDPDRHNYVIDLPRTARPSMRTVNMSKAKRPEGSSPTMYLPVSGASEDYWWRVDTTGREKSTLIENVGDTFYDASTGVKALGEPPLSALGNWTKD